MKQTLCVLIFLSLIGLKLRAQGDTLPLHDHEKGRDLKIGLVLSGGGAKAMSHIGALKVIEKAGIHLDYIGGTSMGAVVGAMYSLGYTADEIEHYLGNVDWDALLANEVPRNRLSYFDRKYDSRYLLNFPVQKGKVKLPIGINYAQYILKELSFITQQAYRYESFRDFPIPFLCVATNLQRGNARVFEDIRLMDALRATSAFPSLFTPYEIQDTLYVDGGVVNNYPVVPVANKGMDVIIGVDVQKFLHEKEALTSVVKVLEQTSSFVNAQELENQLKLTDILIKPEVEEAGITTFGLFDTLVKSGEHAAMKFWPELVNLAFRDKGKHDSLRLKAPALPMQKLFVNEINIEGNKTSTDDYIRAKLRIKENDTCSISELERGMDLLYGSKYFETVDYTIANMDSGYRLNINLKEKQVLTTFRTGINYNDDFKTALLLNFTQRNLFFKNSRFSVDLALGDNPRAYIDYFVDRGYIPTLGFRFRTYRFEYRNFEQFKASNQGVYQDFSLDLFLQSTILDAYALGGGMQIENVDINQQFETSGIEELNKSFINYYGFIDFDSFDDEYFPREGFQLSSQYRIIAEREGFETFRVPSSVLDIHYNQVIRLGNTVTLIGRTSGFTTIGSDLDFPYKIHLGSLGHDYPNYIQPFVGYRFMELTGRNALVARGDIFYEFIKKHYLIARYNIGKLEPTFDDLFASRILLDGYSLGYSYDSAVGPLEINVMGSSNHRNIYAYIQLGFWF